MFSRIKPIRPVAFNNDGSTFARALGWTDVCTSGTGPINVALGFDWDTFQNSDKYYAVLLDSATEYTFTGTHAYSQAKFDLYNMAGTKVAENTAQWLEEGFVMPPLVWTPTTTGVYVVRVSYGGEMPDGEVTYATSISPRPAAHTMEGFTPYGTSDGFDELGCIIRTRSAGEAMEVSAPVGLTANDSDPDWVVAASAEYNNDSRASQSFSGGANVSWTHMNGFTGWISWRNLRRKVLVRKYSVSGGGASTANNGWVPSNWTLEGSDDGINWTVLESVANGFGATPTTASTVTRVVAGNYTRYYYHRLNISDTYDHSDGVSVGQIQAWSK